MLKHLVRLFLTLRAVDLLNLSAGIWFVPRFVEAEQLGAVLPLTSFATFASIPFFAIAMTAMRESAAMRSRGESGLVVSMVRRVFSCVSVSAAGFLALGAVAIPEYAVRLGITDSSVARLAFAAALVGCASPVFLDQLQAERRFAALGNVQLVSAAARILTLAAVMPFKALIGYFAGGVVRPLVEIGSSILLLRGRGEQAEKKLNYWNRENTGRFVSTCFRTLGFLIITMGIGWLEADTVRSTLTAAESAGWYMASRVSDLLNYLTLPLMVVLFPYVTHEAENGRAIGPLLAKSSIAITVAALLLTGVAIPWGDEIITLLPNGGAYANHAAILPALIATAALGGISFVIMNSLVAAGRFSFLAIQTPFHIGYAVILKTLPATSPSSLAFVYLGFAAARAGLLALTSLRPNRRSGPPRQTSQAF